MGLGVIESLRIDAGQAPFPGKGFRIAPHLPPHEEGNLGQFSLTFGAGMEYDLDSKMDRDAGTSGIVGLESFSINASGQQISLAATPAGTVLGRLAVGPSAPIRSCTIGAAVFAPKWPGLGVPSGRPTHTPTV